MRKNAVRYFFPYLFSLQSFSSLLSWTPDFIKEASTTVVITPDALKVAGGLFNYGSASHLHVNTSVTIFRSNKW
ncbi:MAG TPA: hypothetical protein VGP55_16800 [Chitinophagaceae bacterium]|nr:hypothetical protein [Chitinophagaceae bacterium]